MGLAGCIYRYSHTSRGLGLTSAFPFEGALLTDSPEYCTQCTMSWESLKVLLPLIQVFECQRTRLLATTVIPGHLDFACARFGAILERLQLFLAEEDSGLFLHAVRGIRPLSVVLSRLTENLVSSQQMVLMQARAGRPLAKRPRQARDMSSWLVRIQRRP